MVADGGVKPPTYPILAELHPKESLKVKLVLKIAAGIVLAVVLLMAGCSALIASAPVQEALDETAAPAGQSETAAPAGQSESVGWSESAGQKNARRSAESYIEMSGFSRSGLIEQLGFEGYSPADATYAVDAIAANWNEQAARSAQEYIDMSGFSHSGLIEQLEFDGYTSTEATSGAAAVGL